MRTQLSKLSVVVCVIIAAIVLCPRPAEAQAQVIKQKFNVPIDVIFHAADFSCLTKDVHIFGTNPTQNPERIGSYRNTIDKTLSVSGRNTQVIE